MERSREEEARRNLAELATGNPNLLFAVGISNLAHLSLTRDLGELNNMAFFVDFYLYAANRFAVELLRRQSANLLFIYHYLEAGEDDYCLLDGGSPSRTHRGGFPAAAVLRDEVPAWSVGMPGSKPIGSGCRNCTGGFMLPLTQGRNRFLLRVRDCTACLYRLP